MKKELPQLSSKTEQQRGHLATIFVNSAEYEYAGDWQWDLNCEAVFCSDVMLGFPPDFEGTMGIIHPGDKELVLQRLTATPGEPISFLQFRIITTWGEVKTLTGRDLQVTEVRPFFEPEAAAVKKGSQEALKNPGGAKWEAQGRASGLSEKIHKTGTWWLHLASGEIHYSDGVFLLYDLPAQAFNAHLHTFFSFIHEEDREVVLEAFSAALRRRAPLHLDFRVRTAKGTLKTVRQITHWEWSSTGSSILYGLVQDITEWQSMESREKAGQFDLRFAEQLLKMNEQSCPIGYWHVNLVTRKVVFSESIYRLYGVRQQMMPGGGINIFLNYVHPDDRDVVKEVTRKILGEHVPPDIDFRIVRGDGKTRYLRQKGQLTLYGESEMVMMVTLQDITPEKASERRLAELQQLVSTAEFAKKNAEELAGLGSWFMDVESGILTWSNGMYALLGLKTKTVQQSQKVLLHYIHPGDHKRFRDEWKLVLEEGLERGFEFRMVRAGQVIQVAASFKMFHYGGKLLFVATLQDLTKQHNLQVELAQRIRISEAVTENMPNKALLTDEENTIVFWNRQAEVAYGIKREQAINKNFFDIFPLLKTAEALALFQQAWNGETVSIPHIKSPGSQQFHDLLLVPIRSEEGTITGIMHLARDVTKEHEMERHLNERVHFIESLVEASTNRLIVMDRHMNYLYCNQQAATFYGLSKEQIIGKNVLEVFPGSANDPTFDHFRRALKGETVKIPAVEGFLEEHNYEVHLVPIKDDNNVVTAVMWTHYSRNQTGNSSDESRLTDTPHQ